MVIRCPKCKNVQQASGHCLNCGVQFEPVPVRKRFGVVKILLCLLVLIAVVAVVEYVRFHWRDSAPVKEPQIAAIPTPPDSELFWKTRREEFVAKEKENSAQSGNKISLSGAESNIFQIETPLEVYEVQVALHESLQNFRKMGFREIIITGKGGERRTIDLTVLDN